MTDGLWRVWCYAVRPGWEDTGGYPSRGEASEVRHELIDDDGYPKRWVRVKHLVQGRPKVDPPKHEIESALQEIAASA